jgi:drug/metabolite transporter superfamily protein YnfA
MDRRYSNLWIALRHGGCRAGWMLSALLWLSGKGSIWLLLPAALSLVIFVWLLTLHPAASGRVYATYGAIYIATALGWLGLVDYRS